ncbi:acyltransferase family protein [Microbacterium sp. gxy059]|uniref:acyltransferase family protein n=1 Tax=Microbacterium sp. gxy059 TaxID=2957199 RepID=UPI003D98DFED
MPHERTSHANLAPPDPSPRSARAEPSGPARIPEIDGLRGIALTLVVLFHLFGHGRVSGGVDVFLMVSGFLLTLSLARALSSGRPIGVLGRWGRTFVRLTPPAAVVLLVVVALSATVLDPGQQLSTLEEVIAAALYLENWQLIDANLAYGAAGPETSPLQHFWSLSVQGQFFLVFPLLALIITRVVRTPRARSRLLWILTVAGTIASFVYAALANAEDPSSAYFSTFARLWEIGLGGIVAGLWLRGSVIPLALRGATGWLGLVAVVLSGFLIDGGAAYPGPLALVPVGGAALVILSTGAVSRRSASRILAHRRLAQLDRISYGLYLWHWPLLIAYLAVFDREDGRVGPLGAIAVLALALLLSTATTFVLRIPTRWAANRGTPAQLIAVLLAISLATLPAYGAHARLMTLEMGGLTSCSGAAALDPDNTECADFELHDDQEALTPGILPPVALRPADDPTRPECWAGQTEDEFRLCTIGDTAGNMTILAVGDSHMATLTDALDEIGGRQGWRIDLATRGKCRWMGTEAHLASSATQERERCARWRADVDDRAASGDYDAVIVASASKTELAVPADRDPDEFDAEQLLAAWAVRADPERTPLVAFRDNPSIFDSLQEKCMSDIEALRGGDCSLPRDRALFETGVEEAVAADPNAHLVDLTDRMCRDEVCDPVVGGVWLLRDNNHLTGTFVRTLTPYIERELVDVLGG